MPNPALMHQAAQRLDVLANIVESAGRHDSALRPTADLLRAVATTHNHYRDCQCAEAAAATELAKAILRSDT